MTHIPGYHCGDGYDEYYDVCFATMDDDYGQLMQVRCECECHEEEES